MITDISEESARVEAYVRQLLRTSHAQAWHRWGGVSASTTSARIGAAGTGALIRHLNSSGQESDDFLVLQSKKSHVPREASCVGRGSGRHSSLTFVRRVL